MSIITSSVLIEKTKAFVQEYMSEKKDISHDFFHVERVVNLAHRILESERVLHDDVSYNPTAVTLAALMHDVGDHQHQDLGEESSAEDPSSIVSATLVSLGATNELARYVQKIVRNVSFFYEPLNPAHIKEVLHTHPELAIVQDADRLDALGVIGIGRKFTRFGFKGGKGSLQDVVDGFKNLYQLEKTIKTEEGKKMANVRMARCEAFEKWWENEYSDLI